MYEDPCATLPDDIRLSIEPGLNVTGGGTNVVVVVAPVANGEGTSEAGSESSSLAGSVSARLQTRRDNSNGGQSKKRLNTQYVAFVTLTLRAMTFDFFFLVRYIFYDRTFVFFIECS